MVSEGKIRAEKNTIIADSTGQLHKAVVINFAGQISRIEIDVFK
ncbi:MAG: hypothetical protein QME41_08045 [Actinomycetota bacterium]|nr:hypothetical protein [Actinomycetota bacterium]